jgi:hypothetical protein
LKQKEQVNISLQDHLATGTIGDYTGVSKLCSQGHPPGKSPRSKCGERYNYSPEILKWLTGPKEDVIL